MEFLKKHDINIEVEDLFEDLSEAFFHYDEEEINMFVEGFDITKQNALTEHISRSLNKRKKVTDVAQIESIIDLLKGLSTSDLKEVDNLIKNFTTGNPRFLWNMLHSADKQLYKTEDKFHEWLSTLSDSTLDRYIFRAADGLKLHSEYVYDPSVYGTKVEIIDGYIAISSTSLKSLDKFKDRMLSTNNCEYEHRIKKHGEVLVHSYVFNMNKKGKK